MELDDRSSRATQPTNGDAANKIDWPPPSNGWVEFKRLLVDS